MCAQLLARSHEHTDERASERMNNRMNGFMYAQIVVFGLIFFYALTLGCVCVRAHPHTHKPVCSYLLCCEERLTKWIKYISHNICGICTCSKKKKKKKTWKNVIISRRLHSHSKIGLNFAMVDIRNSAVSLCTLCIYRWKVWLVHCHNGNDLKVNIMNT